MGTQSSNILNMFQRYRKIPACTIKIFFFPLLNSSAIQKFSSVRDDDATLWSIGLVRFALFLWNLAALIRPEEKRLCGRRSSGVRIDDVRGSVVTEPDGAEGQPKNDFNGKQLIQPFSCSRCFEASRQSPISGECYERR